MGTPSVGEAHFQKRLGLFDATMLVAGSMIGSGVYIVSAEIARDVNGAGWLLVVWAIAGIMTILGALAYAELAAMMPHAGGQYVYLREAYSPLWGFLYGWTSFTVIQTGTIAAVGVAFAKFLGVLVPTLGTGSDAVIWSGPGFSGIPLPVPGLKEPIRLFAIETFRITWGQFVGVGMIMFLTIWNTRGVQMGKVLQNIFTVTKIGSLIAVIVVAFLVTWNSAIWRANFLHPWDGIVATQGFRDLQATLPNLHDYWAIMVMVMGGALVGALFSADAWNNVTFTAGEVRNPQRNLPMAMILGTGGVIALYLLVNTGYLGGLALQPKPVLEKALAVAASTTEEKERAKLNDPKFTNQQQFNANVNLKQFPIAEKATTAERGIARAKEDRVATALVDLAAPGWGAIIMAVAIMISTFGCANGLILMGARLTYAMARDGLFFKTVGKLNRHGVPAAGLWFQAIWASVLTFSGTYGNLLDYVIFSALLFYALTAFGLFVLRFRRPKMERPYRAWGFPFLPALYILLCIAVMVNLLIVKPVYTWPGLILVLLGVPVYLLWRIFSPKVEPQT